MSLSSVVTILCLSLFITYLQAVPSYPHHISVSRQRHRLHPHPSLNHHAALHVLRRAQHVHATRGASDLERKVSGVAFLFGKLNSFAQRNLRQNIPNISSRQGLIGDFCSSDTDCQDPRECITLTNGEAAPCTESSPQCACFAQDSACSSSDDCDSGELCLNVPSFQGKICVSENALASVNVTVADAGDGSDTVSIASGDSPLIDGVNGGACTSESDCAGSRSCVTLMGASVVSCSGQENCVCIAENPVCTTNSDCDSGEFCQLVDAQGATGVCLSTFLVPDNPAAQAAEDEVTSDDVNDDGLEEDGEMGMIPVETDEDGEMGMMPVETDENGEMGMMPVDTDEDGEMGMMPVETDENGEMEMMPVETDENGEMGMMPVDTDEDGKMEMMPVETDENGEMGMMPVETDESNITTDEPAPTDDGLELFDSETTDASEEPTTSASEPPVLDGDEEVSVCISTHHLSHLGFEELLYSTHRVARVLCDQNNSCATPGHMVKYNGVPMMMSTYCQRVGCTNKIKTVNSPRYSPGKLVKSDSDGLEFTAHAARYNSRMEEKLLSVAVRIGF